MHKEPGELKRGDALYCHKDNESHCECIVRVLSREERVPPGQGAGYHVVPLSNGRCRHIHDDCCANRAIKVSEAFIKYWRLFGPKRGGVGDV